MTCRAVLVNELLLAYAYARGILSAQRLYCLTGRGTEDLLRRCDECAWDLVSQPNEELRMLRKLQE